MLSVSGKFGLNSHSTTSNDNLSSRGNVSPNMLSASSRLRDDRYQYENSSIEKGFQLENQIIIQTEEAGTQTNESLRFQPHLNYFNNLQQQRMSRSASQGNRKFFNPLVIGSDERNSYQKLVSKLKNFYTQQSKFLFDSITNKTYSEYKQTKSDRDESLKKKKKKQKKILQITSKPQKKHAENSYVDLHKHQNEIMNKDILKKERDSNFLNYNYNNHSSNLSNQNKLIVINSSFPQNRKKENIHNQSISPLRSNHNKKNFEDISSNNNKMQIGYQNSPNQVITQSNHVNKSSSQKSKDMMSKSTQSTQRIQSGRGEYRSMSNSSQEIDRNPYQNQQKGKGNNYSSNNEEYEEEQDENNNIYSNTLDISSNTTSDVLPPIHISLGVSQFKKKSVNNSAIQDSQLIISTKKNSQNNQFLESGNFESSSNQQRNKNNSKKSVKKQMNPVTIQKEINSISNSHYQQNQSDQINQQKSNSYFSSVAAKGNQVQSLVDDLCNEDEFISRYINQDQQSHDENQLLTQQSLQKKSKSNKEKDSFKEKRSSNSQAKIRNQIKNYSPGVKDHIKFQQSKYFQDLKSKYTNKHNKSNQMN